MIAALDRRAAWATRAGARLRPHEAIKTQTRTQTLKRRFSLYEAQRFYLRLGFKPIESSAIAMRLEWRAPCHPEARMR
jgi:hypothetical protein